MASPESESGTAESIVERQRFDGWGKPFVERLAQDLQAERREDGKPDIDLHRAWVSSPGGGVGIKRADGTVVVEPDLWPEP